jgi:hypothetical protein
MTYVFSTNRIFLLTLVSVFITDFQLQAIHFLIITQNAYFHISMM